MKTNSVLFFLTDDLSETRTITFEKVDADNQDAMICIAEQVKAEFLFDVP